MTEEAVAIRRELADVTPDRYRPDLAQSLNDLGAVLWELGRRSEALPVTEEAVAIRRELADAGPDRYRSDLAQSLGNLGAVLWELGRRTRGAAGHAGSRRDPPGTSRRQPGPLPPRSCPVAGQPRRHVLGAGAAAEALPVTKEAVAIRRELADASPDRYRPDLAQSLDNLGYVLSDWGAVARRCR